MSIGRLRRNLDLDLIARMKAGAIKDSKPLKRVKPVREAAMYRGARRNAAHGEVWQGFKAQRVHAEGSSARTRRRGKSTADRAAMLRAEQKRARRSEIKRKLVAAGGFIASLFKGRAA